VSEYTTFFPVDAITPEKIIWLFVCALALRFVPSRTAAQIEAATGDLPVAGKGWCREMWVGLSNSTILGLLLGLIIMHASGRTLSLLVLPPVMQGIAITFVRAPDHPAHPFRAFNHGRKGEGFNLWKSASSVSIWSGSAFIVYHLLLWSFAP